MGTPRPRVFVTHRDVPDSAVRLLADKCEVIFCPAYPRVEYSDILQHCRDVDAIFWVSSYLFNAEVMDAAGPRLRVVATMSVGYEKLDVAEARRRGIQLGFVPHINYRAVAELAIGLLLEVTRRIPEARVYVYKNEWMPFRPQWMMGKDIVGSTVGIVGLGSIGQAIAKRLLGFEVGRLLYCGPRSKPEGAALGAEFVSFEELLRDSDFVLVSCPLNDSTRHLFNDETFSLMKPTAVFINIARGGIVDQDALIRALKAGTIWGAGLDVVTPEPMSADHPLLQLKNCVMSPHLGAMTEKTQRAMAEITARNILAALEGHDMPSPIP